MVTASSSRMIQKLCLLSHVFTTVCGPIGFGIGTLNFGQFQRSQTQHFLSSLSFSIQLITLLPWRPVQSRDPSGSIVYLGVLIHQVWHQDGRSALEIEHQVLACLLTMWGIKIHCYYPLLPPITPAAAAANTTPVNAARLPLVPVGSSGK